MQDIDFDEIDRAVSSVTNKGTSEPSAPEVEATPVVEAVTPVTDVLPSPAARRSTGRFMDVVHPSSDMRPSTLGREKGPFAPSMHREEPILKQNEVSDRPVPAATASAAFHWPDPIELAEETPAPAPTPEPTPVVESPAPEPEPVVLPDLEELIDDDDEEAAPLESPFLPDAKVDKRPLGAFSDDSHTDLPLLEDFPAPSAHLAEEAKDTPKEDTAPAPEIEQESTDIPRELHEDVLLLDTHAQDEVEDEPELLTAGTSETALSVEDIPVGPTSITQQYKEQPSTAAQTSGSIFDTEAYHQALTHPAKKRSRATMYIWIAALVIVGGGIGAAIYFVVLPLLG